MIPNVDITAVLTAHAEGVLAGPSLVAFEQAIAVARRFGLTVETLIVLDRPDAATRRQLTEKHAEHRVIVTDYGDPGLARNAAVQAAHGRFITFLDGDDLWSKNWLVSAYRFCEIEPGEVIAHSQVNVIFGLRQYLFWHVDSRAPEFDAGYLRGANYWDAMAFAPTAIYRRYPFAASDLSRGFGHEDWHWNCVTLSAGIDHRPVAGTVHFKRRRRESRMVLCDELRAIPWKTPISSYGWKANTG